MSQFLQPKSLTRCYQKNLSLIIAGHGVKPAVDMKTLSGLFRFVVLGVLVILVVVSCCEYAFVAPGTLVPGTRSFAFVDIGSKERRPPYVEWKGDGTKFKQALEHVCDHHGEYDLFVLRHDTDQEAEHWKKRCNPNHPQNIRTVKVTKSKATDNIAAGESAVNDPHVTYRVQSPNPGDIDEVLRALK